MRLFIAEKPSPARAIADILPKPHRRGEGYIACGNDHIVTVRRAPAGAGSARQLRQPLCALVAGRLAYRAGKVAITAAPLGGEAAERDQKLLEQADEIIHAGDPDREGQLLVDEVLDYLALPPAKREKVQRCLINDLNPQAVERAVGRLRQNKEFIPLCVSALARARADWLYGINMTRAWTLLGRNAGYDGVLSVGRVQTPVLGLVVRRDEEIENFIPKDYFEVKAHIVTPKEERFVALWQPSDACEPGRMKRETAASSAGGACAGAHRRKTGAGDQLSGSAGKRYGTAAVFALQPADRGGETLRPQRADGAGYLSASL